MPTRYFVLRANRDITDRANPFGLGLQRQGTSVPDELSLDIVDGRETDRGRLLSDPKNVAVGDADIRLALVEPAQATNNPIALEASGTLRVPHGLHAVGADTSPFTGQGVTVAVLDTGIDRAHPAFAGKTLVTRDFTGELTSSNDADDLSGHGTHCAGTICGVPVDGVRVGIAPGVNKLCVGRVIGKQGATLEWLMAALFWAAFEQKAAVVSLSLSYDLPGNVARLVKQGWDPALAGNAALRQQSDVLQGISRLRDFLLSQSTNIVFAAASGNESKRPRFVLDAGLPAAELLAVGAVGQQGGEWQVADFSNGRVHLVAPGVDVVSAAPGGGWKSLSGTSMATPHVAGVAALWTEKLRRENAHFTPDMVGSALRLNATRRGLATSDINGIGAGFVRAPQ